MPGIAVTGDGTVLLGDHVSCDGFQWSHAARVQTHIHADHMRDFRRSKGRQDILMSKATRELLVALMDFDIPYRNNIIALDCLGRVDVGTDTVEVADSGHMLGSIQVRVTSSSGFRMGYSSDFFWPLGRVLEVDELVLNSPYGSPEYTREYGQREVEDRFVELVRVQLRKGPVVVLGYRGRLQHAMSLLAGQVRQPVLVSRNVAVLSGVYDRHGVHLLGSIEADAQEGRRLIAEGGRYLAFMELTEQRQCPWLKDISKVLLSAYAVPREAPVLDYGNGDFRVALTDHADFAGTLEYVRASGATRVLVHPFSGTPDVLAGEIRRRMSCQAVVAEPVEISEWA